MSLVTEPPSFTQRELRLSSDDQRRTASLPRSSKTSRKKPKHSWLVWAWLFLSEDVAGPRQPLFWVWV